jgi:Uma2 family endonuclease
MQPILHSPESKGEGPHTWEEFVALDEDDLRELIDGELVEVEVPSERHERIVGLLVYFLTAWALPIRAGYAYVSGYKVRIDRKRGVMPDVQFFRRDNPANKNQQGVTEGRPDLVVEVLSPSSRSYDRVRKQDWYLKIGVPEYWIVDPEAHTLERLVAREGAYVHAGGFEGEVTFSPESFPGLSIPLAELWRDPDQAPSTSHGS